MFSSKLRTSCAQHVLRTVSHGRSVTQFIEKCSKSFHKQAVPHKLKPAHHHKKSTGVPHPTRGQEKKPSHHSKHEIIQTTEEDFAFDPEEIERINKEFEESLQYEEIVEMEQQIIQEPKAQQQSIRQKLNPRQEEAVCAKRGPSLVIAGPGSGKTRVLVHRIVHLIQEEKISPNEIFVVTFTKKAAEEMKTRLQELLPEEQFKNLTYVGTFHHICFRVLKKYITFVKPALKNNFVVVDDKERKNMISQCLFRVRKAQEKYIPISTEAIMTSISKWKNYEKPPSMVLLDMNKELEKYPTDKKTLQQYHTALVYDEYEKLLGQANRVDFDDLLLLTASLFQKHENVRYQYSKMCQALLIDEFQDTNALQYKIAYALAQENKNIFVVGDPDQSIYGWRHANNSQIVERFKKDFPEQQTILLEENYRSSQNIVQTSNNILSSDNKSIFTNNPRGPPISVVRVISPGDEARKIAEEIKKLIEQSNNVLQYRDFAVLTRVNAMSRHYETVFNEAEIPFVLRGSVAFFQRREIRDLIAYLSLTQNLDDDDAFERIINVPRRGAGHFFVSKLKSAAHSMNLSLFGLAKLISLNKMKVKGVPAKAKVKELIDVLEDLHQAAKNLPPLDALQLILEKTNYEKEELQRGYDKLDIMSRVENVKEFITFCHEFSQNLQANPEAVATGKTEIQQLIDSIPIDARKEDSKKEIDINSVTISTLHSAKGLEFGVVFIIGCEEGIIPYHKSLSDEEIKEEKRLLFVGMTRAKSMLYLTYNTERETAAKVTYPLPSSFLLPLKDFYPSLFDDLHEQRAKHEEAKRQEAAAAAALLAEAPQPAEAQSSETNLSVTETAIPTSATSSESVTSPPQVDLPIALPIEQPKTDEMPKESLETSQPQSDPIPTETIVSSPSTTPTSVSAGSCEEESATAAPTTSPSAEPSEPQLQPPTMVEIDPSKQGVVITTFLSNEQLNWDEIKKLIGSRKTNDAEAAKEIEQEQQRIKKLEEHRTSGTGEEDKDE